MPRDRAPSLLARLISPAGDRSAPWDGPPPTLPALVDRLSERWFGLPPRVRTGVLATTAAVVLLATGLGAARSPWGPPVEVVVLAGDVEAGAVLDRGLLTTARRPARLVPGDAFADATDVGADARAAGHLVAGTVLSARHLADEDGVTGALAADRAAYPLDAATLPRLVAGQRVDVVAGDVSGDGRLLARDARVLAVLDGTVWIDVARADAVGLAGAAVRDGLRVVLLPPG